MRNSLLKMSLLLLPMVVASCAFSPKFSGPLFDQSKKIVQLDPNQEVILALTHAKLDRPKRSSFDRHSREIFTNLKSFEGYIGGTVRVEILGDEVWTMTAWKNEEALKKFVSSTQHLDAMYMSNQAMKKFRHLNVKVFAKDLPYSWDQAQKLLETKDLQDNKPY